MANVNSRIRRIGEQIRRELADLIRTELHDPRLTLVSMTSIEVSRDLAHARIYVTVVCDPDDRAGLVAELNRAASLLRRELGRRMHIRTVPKLEFRYDEVVEHGARLSALIDAAVAADARRHHDDEVPLTNDPDSENAA
ncbi:MAG: 30S ribosome-binding factor RbfA [Candidatus Competibacteraceae bacterium]|uniref:Ribosome-binding factor A n=1 Tax=Candidatus Contendobacter odensis Run_B_J11 TaxID=1400861 RepID=A0A7U7GFT8_9GAMM|nr:30S ribosome-binding factor RbfA [Candidatus Contendobacter odensis]MBK8534282.1 30S ribosome-binding factor RbfA [Candidatus Competibacteraceae bacterium]MBK8751936.1 30S ribosome-binding factor RbfA [Candidatus Competibacteraceae bacterium]CDH47626.1 Ribosome-binding factor A [Candidatus Contendobacter odensis Run_B_J11]